MAGYVASKIRAHTAMKNAHRNPLVGFRKDPSLSIKEAAVHHAPLLSPMALKVFDEKMRKSDNVLEQKGLIPLRLLIDASNNNKDDEHALAVGLKEKALVALAGINQRAEKGLPPGEPGRLTPVTPFNLLHQLDHELDGNLGKLFNGALNSLDHGFIDQHAMQKVNILTGEIYEMIRDLQVSEDEKRKLLFSYGVPSRNADLGVFRGEGVLKVENGGLRFDDQARGDMFAVYMLSMAGSASRHDLVTDKIDSICFLAMGSQPAPATPRWARGTVRDLGERKTAKYKEKLLNLKMEQLAWLEVNAAFTAFTLTTFVDAYYHNQIPNAKFWLSEDTIETLTQDRPDDPWSSHEDLERKILHHYREKGIARVKANLALTGTRSKCLYFNTGV